MLEHSFLETIVEMEADDEYQQQLDLFVRSCDEKARVFAQLQKLLQRLPRHKTFLDVGAGAGDLTVPLSRSFAHTTVVEPNPLQAMRLADAHPQFEVHNVPIEDFDLSGEPFDLILCSHVLYYVPQTRWLGIVQKLYERLRPGGMVVIILQSPAGEMAQFFEHFACRQVPVIPLWDSLVTCYGEDAVEAHYCSVVIRTKTLEEMTSLGLFLLLDRRFRRRTEEMRAYFAEHHRASAGYMLRQGEITLAVTRSAGPAQKANTSKTSLCVGG